MVCPVAASSYVFWYAFRKTRLCLDGTTHTENVASIPRRNQTKKKLVYDFSTVWGMCAPSYTGTRTITLWYCTVYQETAVQTRLAGLQSPDQEHSPKTNSFVYIAPPNTVCWCTGSVRRAIITCSNQTLLPETQRCCDRYVGRWSPTKEPSWCLLLRGVMLHEGKKKWFNIWQKKKKGIRLHKLRFITIISWLPHFPSSKYQNKMV